jgi:hypothetical protein
MTSAHGVPWSGRRKGENDVRSRQRISTLVEKGGTPPKNSNIKT